MRSRIALAAFAVASLLLIAQGAALAQPPQQAPPAQKPAAPASAAAAQAGAEPSKAPAPTAFDRPLSVSRHVVTVEGKPVPYTATVGELVVAKPDETPGASMFFAAYTRDDIKDRSTRPLMFLFNGGPGSSTLWLHLGGLGPKRVALDDFGDCGAPPYALVDSDLSLLDVTDLVFIDAVSTGFSRPLPGEAKSQFHGVDEDVAAFGEFIRAYVSRFARWGSPKFVLGESYGTTRAAGLSGWLQGRANGMYLNGIVLLSSVLDFSTITFAPMSEISYISFLPHYTATAWFHKKLPADLLAKPLRAVLDEAERFALDEYPSLLVKGNRLTAAEYDAAAAKIARLTGLRPEYVKQANLRVEHGRFVKELRRSDLLTVGRLDSRFIGHDADAAGETYDNDPSSAAISGAFPTLLNAYVRDGLGYKKDIPYSVYGNVYPWNFQSRPDGPGEGGPRSSMGGPPNVALILRQALADNAHLRVFCCNGYYDGATPYFGTEYTFAQMGFNGEFKDRVAMGYYEAGHMMYIHRPSLVKLRKDLTDFIRAASK
jgi:carboxypeptidase C (cathepsin A)